MYQTANSTKAHLHKGASVFKQRISSVCWARAGCARRPRFHLFDILTWSCRQEQCADTGHLASALFIHHLPKNKVKEILQVQLSGFSPLLYLTRISELNAAWPYLLNYKNIKLIIPIVGCTSPQGSGEDVCNTTLACHGASVPPGEFRGRCKKK